MSFHAMDIVEGRQFCSLRWIFWPQMQISSNNIFQVSLFFPQIFNRMFGCYSYMYMVIKWSRYMPVRCEALCWGIVFVRHWLVTLQYSVTLIKNDQLYSSTFFSSNNDLVRWSRYIPVRCEALMLRNPREES